MAGRRMHRLVFPVGGLVRNTAYQQQAPFTTPDCRNVRPFDVEEGRGRGGSRPGMARAFAAELGSGTPVRLLADVRYVHDTVAVNWQDSFEGGLSGEWSAADWCAGGALDSYDDRYAANTDDYAQWKGLTRAQHTTLDTGSTYTIRTYIYRSLKAYASYGTYGVALRMDNTTPNSNTDGILVTISPAGNTIEEFKGGGAAKQTVSLSAEEHGSGELKIVMSAAVVTVYFNGTSLGTLTVGETLNGTRWGIGGKAVNAFGGNVLFDYARIDYFESIGVEQTETLLIASANGSLYKEEIDGLSVLSPTRDLASDRLLQAAERGQKLFIADNGNLVEESTGTVVETTKVMDDAAVSDWVAAGVTTDHQVVITGGTQVTAGTYDITTVAVGTLTLTTDPTSGGNASVVEYYIKRFPKVYDPSGDSLEIWEATDGTLPTDCKLICRYRDRIVLAKENVWYMSRSGDAYDFDYGADADDAERAVAGSSSDAGEIGDDITAQIPWADDYLLFGCARSLWLLRGDPAYGGRIANVSRAVGIVDAQAWCHGPNGEIIFLSHDGLYGLAPGAQSVPKSLSRELLPDELREIDTDNYTVLLAYSVKLRGVHVFLTPNDEVGGNLHWWFDWQAQSFWPDTYDSDHEPTSVVVHRPETSSEASVLLGGRDGYVRKFDRAVEQDDGENIEAYVVLGPFRPGGSGYRDGIVDELIATLDDDSGSVDYELSVAESAEDALNGLA